MGRPNPELDMMQEAKEACSVQLAKNKKKLLAVPLSLVGREKTRGETNKKATAARTRGPCRVACGRFGLYRVLNLHLQDQCLEIHASEADAGAPALYTIRLEGAKLTVNGVNKFTIKSPKKTFYFRPKTEAECSQWLCALHQVTGLVRRVTDFYLEDYKCGEGATCVVQRCRNRLTGAPCAIKSRIDPYDEIGRHGLYNELRILQILSKHPHPSIPALEDCFFDKSGDIQIAMEYMNRGELHEMIEQRRGLTEDIARDLFFQIADGVRHLHRNRIAHRDIKPSNIMLAQCPDGKLRCKIIDYDLARASYAEQWVASNPCGTAEFMAPEILENKLYTLAVDIWSLGCVLYGMLVGRCPFKGADYRETRRNILENRIQTEILDDFTPEARDLVLKMLEHCPERRLTADEVDSNTSSFVTLRVRGSCLQVLEHPWLCSSVPRDRSARHDTDDATF